MTGQRERLPAQALGYVNSTKVILGLPETAGVHFLLRPHHYILKVQLTCIFNGNDYFNDREIPCYALSSGQIVRHRNMHFIKNSRFQVI